MKTLEDLVVQKLGDLINLVLARVIKPDIKLDKVTELDEEAIAKLKEQYGIEGIILDVDETLRKNMSRIPKCNEDWIERLRGQLKVVILTNGIDREIEGFFKGKGIDYIDFAQKPLKKNFMNACNKMMVDPEKVLVVGDSLFADIHGGRRNRMKTALVKNVEDTQK